MVSMGDREPSTTYLSARAALSLLFALPHAFMNAPILSTLVSGVRRLGIESREPGCVTPSGSSTYEPQSSQPSAMSCSMGSTEASCRKVNSGDETYTPRAL